MATRFRLLDRREFREGVFARDGHRCVFRDEHGQRCSAPAVDAHHILERRLWPDGGYYLDNGASLCEAHHLACERTLISCEDLRRWCSICTVLVPEHLDAECPYDKWGNPVLPNGQRMRGELFESESAQRALASVLYLFTSRVKYPRTFHLPWSPGLTSDDRKMDPETTRLLLERDIVLSLKMDGECTTMYRDGIHARSLDSEAHPSRTWVRGLHATIAKDIPDGWRLCGENLYATHSIHYEHLRSFFLLFSVWDGLRCLSWSDTCQYAEMLGLATVPTIAVENRSPESLASLGERFARDGHDGDPCEGYVIRTADEFAYGAFHKNVGKYVRSHHVQTAEHWLRQPVVPNALA